MKITLLISILILFDIVGFSQHKYSRRSAFPGYKGLVMAGYQGWFNAPEDGAHMNWNHYATHDKFEPGFCKIDFWPDIREYQKLYKTPFIMADGNPAYLFSSYDKETVNVHFRWMKEYGLDGVFIQRSITALKNPDNRQHDDKVLMNAMEASRKYGRAIAVMYDFSHIDEVNMDYKIVIQDWKHLVDSLHIACLGSHQTYLYHHKKPLVGIWGVGFPERSNNLHATEKIIDFLKYDPVYGGCAILLGVPAYWRDFGKDTEKDPYLHEIIRKADIIRPWFVGRFNEETYGQFRERLKPDMAWCRQNRIDYVPVVFPGFSWHNMHPESTAAQIPRNNGRFYWEQLIGSIHDGAEMIYVAMFDEMDEGTAIFKTTKSPPVGLSKFEKFEDDIPEDYYLYLTGIASSILKKKMPFQTQIPLPVIK